MRPLSVTHLAIAALITVAACDAFSARPALVHPELAELWVQHGSLLHHGGVLTIRADPKDRDFRLNHAQRVPIELSASSGDAESLGLYRYRCPARGNRGSYECFTFLIMLREGYSVSDVEPRVQQIAGRVLSSSQRFVGVVLFTPDQLVRTARKARSWPEVAYVELQFPSCVPDASGCLSPSQLARPIRLDRGDAIVGDGTLQVQAGDVVTLRYRQPNGQELTYNLLIP